MGRVDTESSIGFSFIESQRACLMLTLYDYLPSQNAWKIRLLLNHLEQPYIQKIVSIFEGEGQYADFLAINPSGAVPALQFDDGFTIAESNAILVYLASDTMYFPSDTQKQAQVLQWLFFEADYVQSSVATLRHWLLTGKDKNRSKEMLASKREASVKVLTILNRRLSDSSFLTGHGYTIADMSVFAYVHLCEDAGISLAAYSGVQRWIDAVRKQPGFLHDVYPYSVDEFSTREL